MHVTSNDDGSLAAKTHPPLLVSALQAVVKPSGAARPRADHAKDQLNQQEEVC